MAAIGARGVLQCVGGDPDVSIAPSTVDRDGSTLEPGLRPISGEVATPVGRQVPLADVASLVAQRGHVICQRRGADGQGDAVAPAAGRGRVEPGLDRGTRRSAHRLHGECLIEHDAVSSQGIEARRDWEALAEDATGVRSLLVRQHDQHIGLSHQVGPTFGR